MAQKEKGRLRAVHHNDPTNIGDRTQDHDEKPHHHFNQRLAETGVSGRIADVGGDWVVAMTDRARWADLVVISRNQTGVEWVVGRLSAEWRQILHNVRQPVLMVPQHPTAMTRALVAYNGLPRGRIALLVGAVLAIRWGVSLVVTSIGKPQVTADYLQEAGHFLESFGIAAEFVAADGNVEPNLLATLESHECDFLIMGGSRSNPLLEIFSGGTVERIIRKSSLPVLLCQ